MQPSVKLVFQALDVSAECDNKIVCLKSQLSSSCIQCFSKKKKMTKVLHFVTELRMKPFTFVLTYVALKTLQNYWQNGKLIKYFPSITLTSQSNHYLLAGFISVFVRLVLDFFFVNVFLFHSSDNFIYSCV